MKVACLQQSSRSQKSRSVAEGAPARAMRLSVLVLPLLLFASPVFAQTNPMVDRLPADAWAYVSWSGTASLKSVSNTNSVLRLWHDPSFSAFLEGSIGAVSHHGGPTQKSGGLTPEQTAEIFSALENPAVAGFLNSPGDSAEQNHFPVSFFFIYDATGKQEIVDKLRRQRDANATEPPQVSTASIAGVTVEKRISKSSTSYEAQAGHYYIFAGSQHAMEELLPRFGAGQAPAVSFTKSPDFPAACQGLAQSSILNALVLPAQFHMPSTPSNSGFDFHAFSSSLHLDGIRAGCFSVSFGKETTRTRGVVLGDTSQGSILNVAGNNRDSFATLSLASSNSSFQGSVIDYAALYNSLFTAVSAGLPSDRAPFMAAAVAFLSSTWGMPPDQFFALFTGETAVIHPDNASDPVQSFYAFTIHDPEKVLHVLQHAMPGEQTSTNQEGDVTYLTVTISAGALGTKSAAPSTIDFALTPDMLLASKEQEVLRHAVARIHAAAGSAQSDALTADPEFQKARALLPAKLDGLSYTNYAHYNWQKLFSEAEKNLNDQMQRAARNANRPVPPLAQIFQGIDPAVLSRYLHVSAGGAWKDSTGIYFDSYIQ
ncbi:MAG: hypothetical protein WBE86_08355 [Candidatus Acidiferrales bacterium]